MDWEFAWAVSLHMDWDASHATAPAQEFSLGHLIDDMLYEIVAVADPVAHVSLGMTSKRLHRIAQIRPVERDAFWSQLIGHGVRDLFYFFSIVCSWDIGDPLEAQKHILATISNGYTVTKRPAFLNIFDMDFAGFNPVTRQHEILCAWQRHNGEQPFSTAHRRVAHIRGRELSFAIGSSLSKEVFAFFETVYLGLDVIAWAYGMLSRDSVAHLRIFDDTDSACPFLFVRLGWRLTLNAMINSGAIQCLTVALETQAQFEAQVSANEWVPQFGAYTPNADAVCDLLHRRYASKFNEKMIAGMLATRNVAIAQWVLSQGFPLDSWISSLRYGLREAIVHLGIPKYEYYTNWTQWVKRVWRLFDVTLRIVSIVQILQYFRKNSDQCATVNDIIFIVELIDTDTSVLSHVHTNARNVEDMLTTVVTLSPDWEQAIDYLLLRTNVLYNFERRNLERMFGTLIPIDIDLPSFLQEHQKRLSDDNMDTSHE